MCLDLIMAMMPRPNVRRAQHRGSPVVAGPLIHGSLSIILPMRFAPRIHAKVSGVSGNVMAILVIQDASIMRSVGPIAPPCRFDQRAMM